MKKTLASRIAGLTALYCLVFIFLVMLQFSGKGNFSLSLGAMTIKGRYLKTEPQPRENDISGAQRLAGGIKISFGGLEFSLKDEREKGLLISGNDGSLTSANPEYIIVTDGEALFGLPGGNSLIFNSFDSARGPELYITAEFAENAAEVSIPIILRRSSLVRDNGQSVIIYGGFQYSFANSSLELESGRLLLSRERASV